MVKKKSNNENKIFILLGVLVILFALYNIMQTASFGGVIRDILCNEIPVIFRKEIYATACIIGASAFILLSEIPLNKDLNSMITVGLVILIRLIAVKYKLSLPTFYHTNS